MPSIAVVTPISIVPAGRAPALAKGLPVTIDVPGAWDELTVGAVKAALVERFPQFTATRQKMSKVGDRAALADDTRLADVPGLAEPGAALAVKDLGPQISWRTVFLVEYGGPLLIHPLFYHFSRIFYGVPVQHSPLQKCLYGAILLHFIKRELETLFIHRFSHATMPARNIVKNSGHYWILSGLFLAYPLYGPTYSIASPYVAGTYRANVTVLARVLLFWSFCELSNLHTHLAVRALRPPGTRTRAIPRGYGFGLVSFPNYLFEALGWAALAALSGSWAAWLFTAVSTGQMMVWAQKKHRAYRKEFGDKYPRGRKAMIPFVF